MLAAHMVAANIAALQRVASAYQAIVAMGAESLQHQLAADDIDPADPGAGISG